MSPPRSSSPPWPLRSFGADRPTSNALRFVCSQNAVTTPALLMLSWNSAVVSTAPLGHEPNTSARTASVGLVRSRFAANIAPNSAYWLPMVGWMLPHFGALGFAGGLCGEKPAWQPAHATPNSRKPRAVL